MISGISKKIIFFFILFINFQQPSKSAESAKINKNINNQNTKFHRSSFYPEKIFSNTLKKFNYKTSFLKSSNKNFDSFLVAKAEKQQELIIQSDKQSEINDVIYAEGNVSVSFGGKQLRADNLIYDKLNKIISAKGNIFLELGDQSFKVAQLEYSFISEKGYLLDVEGSINTNTLMDDLAKSSINVLVLIDPSTSNKYPFSLIKLYSSCATLKDWSPNSKNIFPLALIILFNLSYIKLSALSCLPPKETDTLPSA